MIEYVRRLKCRRMPGADLRAARANRVFCTDEKRIRTENTVMDKNRDGLGWVLSKIEALKSKVGIGHHA
jgi:hypothetical protein